LHAVSHPLRVRILDELREPASAAELGRRLGESRQNVSYHLRELARGGLVQRVGERRARGFLETLYRASAAAVVVTSSGPWPLVDCDRSSSSANANPLSFAGSLVAIYVAPAAEAPATAVDEVRAVPGRGLEGDRYFDAGGTFSDHPGNGRDVTLIEIEALQALRAETGIELAQAESRRNLVTSGVPLNHLVGRELRVGEVLLRGARLCEPCSHLERLTEAGVLAGLVHRGGLRADILRGGVIRAGDPVEPV
jgi:DNA-binding transcriptional ArsR family regulator